MDLDFGFVAYVAALLAAGALMLVLAVLNFDRKGSSRAINGLIGLAALGYGGYLAYQYLLVEAFTYRRFWYAYALPLLAIYQLYQGLKERRAQREAVANPTPYTAQPETPAS